MLKKIVIFLLLFLPISCGGGNKVIQSSNNKVPSWYLEETKDKNIIYGKSLAESENLEIAMRKAQSLAIANIGIKIKNETNVLRNIFIAQNQNMNKEKTNEITEKFDESITIVSNQLNINDFKISKKNVFKDGNIYKVYMQIEIDKNQIINKIPKN
jgi:hypothetical protein